MATQTIRFTAPPNQTITLDVFTLDSDTAVQSTLTCAEATNRKGLYVSQDFTDTLIGRHLIVKKISSVAIGNDFVDLLNANATYDAESLNPTATVAAINADATQTAARTAALNAETQTTPTNVRTAVGLESANLASLVNAVVGKQNVTDNGNGTYDIAIRNAADDATLVTIRYNPTTGVKTVL